MMINGIFSNIMMKMVIFSNMIMKMAIFSNMIMMTTNKVMTEIPAVAEVEMARMSTRGKLMISIK